MKLTVSMNAAVDGSVSPFERFGRFIVALDVFGDLAGQVGFGGEDAASDQIALNLENQISTWLSHDE